MLKIIYTIFLGLILALFVGLGISTFYEGPKQPEYPMTRYSTTKEGNPTEEQIQKDKEYETLSKQYSDASETYNRNVSIFALVASLIMLVAGLLFEKKNVVIGGGVLLGGLFTLVYSIIRGFASTDTKYTFIVVTVGLAMALYLGYHKFAQSQVPNKRTK